MAYEIKKRRKFHDLNAEQEQQIKEDAAEAYEMARSFENPYPKYSDAWEAWENGIDWKRRFEALMDEF